MLNKNNKKSLVTTISTITMTKLPVIIALITSFLTLISSNILMVITPFAKICSALSVVLGCFGFKYSFEEEDNTFIKKYVLIQIVYYVA